MQHLGPTTDLVVLSANPEQTTSDHGVVAIERLSLGGIWRELSIADLFISGGGGLIQDSTGLGSVPYYAGLLGLAQWLRVPTMLLGAGVGPLKTALGRTLSAIVARNCAVCAVRDPLSVDILHHLGVKRVKLVADPVIALDPAPPSRIDTILSRAGIELGGEPLIAVAIRPWPGFFERQFKAFSAVVAQMAARVGAQIVLLPFQRPHDDRITYELADCLRFRPLNHAVTVTLLDEVLGPADLLGLISRCHLVVGMRLHALIMAAASRVPFLGVAYDPKVAQFAKTWGMPVIPGLDVLEDSGRMETLFSQFWNQRDEGIGLLAACWQGQRDLALENFRLARSLAIPRPRGALSCGLPRTRPIPPEASHQILANPTGASFAPRAVILGIPVDPIDQVAASGRVARHLENGEPLQIVTLNAEMTMLCRTYPQLGVVIRGCGLVLCDGVGVVWAANRRGARVGKLPGIEFVHEICAVCVRFDRALFLLGSAPGVAAMAADGLRRQHPGLVIAGTQDGYFTPDQEPAILGRLYEAAPGALLVGLGVPRQELWIASHQHDLGIPVCMGVGGSFDILSGRLRRAPPVIQAMHLEWLYRLVQEPWRWRRMLRTLPVFALLALASERLERYTK